MIQRDEIPEVIVILVALIMLAIPPGIVIALVWYFCFRSKAPQQAQGPRGIQERLSEIDGLRSRNLISAAEHEDKRRQILSGIQGVDR